MPNNISRRSFLKIMGAGAATTLATSCGLKSKEEENVLGEPPVGQMTYRTNPTTGDKVSLLGYGMMRLPKKDGSDEFDQELINQEIDYAIEHGMNYFDTSPVYCQGQSERCTGIALKAQKRLQRHQYYVATKLSNFDKSYWSKEASIQMYHDSMKELQVDYIDYYLLHAVGGGGMENFSQRYLDNGILDYLLEEREAGRIRNLGFSFHGDIEVFDYLLANHDKYRWDFVQIQLNYLDWTYANEMSDANTDASYLYEELHKRGIPAVIMEPLLGGRLVKDVPAYVVDEMKRREPQRSVASWAFRYAGTPEGVLTVLSGMTFMEHLKDNLLSYCPLKPLTEEEQRLLDTKIAHQIMEGDTIPCNNCEYCMPCPYGIDIPGNFLHYNKWKVDGRLPENPKDKNYQKNRRDFLISLDRAVPRDRQPDHCIQCNRCIRRNKDSGKADRCPQKINIPEELEKIARLIEDARRHG